MRLEIDIPDDLADKYESHAKMTSTKLSLRKEIEDRVARFQDAHREDRCIVLMGDDRREIEAIFQTTIDTPKKLIKLLKTLGSVKIGPVTRAFTADEIIRLKDQAMFHGWEPERFIALTVDEALNYVFERM